MFFRLFMDVMVKKNPELKDDYGKGTYLSPVLFR